MCDEEEEETEEMKCENVSFKWSTEREEDYGYRAVAKFENQDTLLSYSEKKGLMIQLPVDFLEGLEESAGTWPDGVERSTLRVPNNEIEIIMMLMAILDCLKNDEEPKEYLKEEDFTHWSPPEEEEEGE